MLFKLLDKWNNKSSEKKLLFIEAYFYILYARILTLLFPFKKIISILGLNKYQENDATSVLEYKTDLNKIKDISWSVITAAKYSPFKSLCLEQALTAQKMLKKRNISGLLYLGVGKDDLDKSKLVAHAWTKVENKVITGLSDFKKYSVVGMYSW